MKLLVNIIYCVFIVIIKIQFTISDEVQEKVSEDWWETASFYQIYPRSFKDSNGDGIGDLNGITERLPYLSAIGIKATWLSPIFKSPMADFGYDISNFFDIQPEYGTLADFDRMIERANELDLKIILDFVPNHTSDENDWFRRSERSEEKLKDFYIWHPGFIDPKNASNRLPPNNWVSVFRGSAWTFSKRRGEFYLHQFHEKQPDLNYRNPKVVEMMKSILRYWLNRGVAGFRIDAVPFLFETVPDSKGNYPDEPLSGDTNDPNDYGYLKHIYTNDQPETIDMVYQWREVMDKYTKDNGGDSRILLAECYSSLDVVMQYYGDGKRNGAQLPFNFLFIERITNSSTANDYKSVIDDWMNKMPKNRTPNWVIGNHDQHRVSARLGTDRIDMMNMIILTLPGASVTYNGEEIGMTDVWISWNDTVDPAACNSNPNDYQRYSRDPERTPFQWDDSISAGFSTNSKTWLPIAENYKTINVESEVSEQNNSHLRCYAALLGLRKSNTLKFGELITKSQGNNILIIYRTLINEPSYITIVHIGDSGAESINLKDLLGIPDLHVQYEIVGVSSKNLPGQIVSTDNVIIQPKESFVLKEVPHSQLVRVDLYMP